MKVAFTFFLAVTLVAADDKTCLDCNTDDSQVLLQSKVAVGENDHDIGSMARMNALSQTATIVKEMIDIDQMADDLKQEAAENVVVLQQQVDDMKPAMNAAKAKFKADRKRIRSNYKGCRKKITWNAKKWKGTSQCAPFVPHMSMLEGEQAEGKGVEAAQDQQERRKPKKKKAKAAARCATRPKCELRQAKRLAKRAVKEDFKNIRKDFRDRKKELRKAKFQKNVLPKIILLLKPELLKALGGVDMNDDSSGQLKTCEHALTQEQTIDCVPLAEINLEELLKNYMNVQLHGQMKDHFEKVFKAIKTFIWKIFDPAKDGVKNSLVAAVGTIPVVGGALAVAVGVLMELIYKAIKYGVESSLDKVSKVLQGELVQGMVNAVFATGLFTTDALEDSTRSEALASELKKTGAAAQKAIEASTQKQIKDEATNAQEEAQKEAEGAESSIKTEGDDVKDGEEEDDQEDVDQYEEEAEEDIDDDDD